ncbi:hypothetical protein BB561_002193 [Smittium simulii]|uniref:Acyl-coenzyme A oxidase n=1 Tax=Smittium simulii TaxID=133385 RepID=A0A2T9YRB9_9FUNG|nr:hypothetical protein BB561_002193 [Smittium simulii]
MAHVSDLVNTRPNISMTAELLAAERLNSTFDLVQMGLFINGEKWCQLRQQALEIIQADPDIFDMTQSYYMNREEQLDMILKTEKRMAELLITKQISHDVALAMTYLLDASGPFRLHRSMFIPTLERQANEEQKKAFLLPARNYEIIGCYAQTEIGHGSNVRGLETTATFIEESDQFEINSPTLTSTKWWIGSLGIAATHACVMAQLIVKQKNIGVYPVIVPIRDPITFKPLPNVNVGDIGPKMGFTTVDNGFVNFQKVRVPRFNVLQRYISISRTGIVTRPENIDPRVTYSTMVFVRAGIVNTMGRELAKAVTIATRYTAVRKQGGEIGNETPVLNYDIVQFRLIPLVAKTFAMLGMSHEFYSQYERCKQNIDSGDFSMLKEMHAVSCALKKWCSDTAVYGIDTCRHLCGGHGFSIFSGLNSAFNNIYPNIIWEGDNFVLAQQTAKYIIKAAKSYLETNSISTNDPTSLILSLYNPNNKNVPWKSISASEMVQNHNLILELLACRFSYFAYDLTLKIHYQNQSWNNSTIAVQVLSTLYSEYMICMYFKRHIDKLQVTSSIYPPIAQLFKITALSFLTRNTGELYTMGEDYALNYKFINQLHDQYQITIKNCRSIIVPLVDSLGIPDEKLNSSLGRYDGKVYEDYMTRASNEPLNRPGTGSKIRSDFYYKYISNILSPNKTPSKL